MAERVEFEPTIPEGIHTFQACTLNYSSISNIINKVKTCFIEVGVLLLAVSVIAEVIFGPNVAFFGSQVT